MVNNIEINYKRKQLTDEELTLKFLSAMINTYDFLMKSEVFITTRKGNKLVKYKTKPSKEIKLLQSENKGKSWEEKKGYSSFKIEYINRKSLDWYTPSISTKCETMISFTNYSYPLTIQILDDIHNGKYTRNEFHNKFEIYLQFIKFLSKSNRKRLIDHLYYMDNNQGTEYSKYKKFINGYLGKSLNVTLGSEKIERIDFFQSFTQIREQRLSQLLKNKKENYESKLMDDNSSLCKRLTYFFNKKGKDI